MTKINKTLSVRENGEWYDTTSADLRHAAGEFAAHKGWKNGTWSVSPVPPSKVPLGKSALTVAFRRFNVVPEAGSPRGIPIEIQTHAEGFIVPKA